MFTLTEIKDNLINQLVYEPENKNLIKITYDALLDDGKEQAAMELECRCWLKTKKRKPYYETHGFGSNYHKKYWFVSVIVTNKPSIDWIIHTHWIPDLFSEPARFKHMLCNTEEEAISDICIWFNSLNKERKENLWQWELPK